MTSVEVLSYIRCHKVHPRLQFHGYQHCRNSEDDIREFLEVLENYYVDDGSLTTEERSMVLAGFTHYHLRGDALLFAEELPGFVHGQWLELCPALIEKYEKIPEAVKLTVPKHRVAEVVAIKTKKSNSCKVPTFDVKLLEREMCELITTTDERTRVLLSVLFVLSCVCQRICMVAELCGKMRFAEDKLRIKRTEQPLIDQAVYELGQLEKEVDVESVEILEEKDSLVKESMSRLEKGIVERCCVFCFPLNHVTGLMSHYVKSMERWRYYVVTDVCGFVGGLYRLGIG